MRPAMRTAIGVAGSVMLLCLGCPDFGNPATYCERTDQCAPPTVCSPQHHCECDLQDCRWLGFMVCGCGSCPCPEGRACVDPTTFGYPNVQHQFCCAPTGCMGVDCCRP